jgi:hypothetical protein
MVTIVQNKGTGKNAGRTFEKIVSTSSMTAKMASKIEDLKNPPKVFDQSDLSTVDIYFTLPEWLRKKIAEGLEWEGSPMAKAVANFKKEDVEDAKKSNTKKGSTKKAADADEDDDAPFETAGPDEGDGDW